MGAREALKSLVQILENEVRLMATEGVKPEQREGLPTLMRALVTAAEIEKSDGDDLQDMPLASLEQAVKDMKEANDAKRSTEKA